MTVGFTVQYSARRSARVSPRKPGGWTVLPPPTAIASAPRTIAAIAARSGAECTDATPRPTAANAARTCTAYASGAPTPAKGTNTTGRTV